MTSSLRWKIFFSLLAAVDVVIALTPVEQPTPILDAIMYLNAAFCVYNVVRA